MKSSLPSFLRENVNLLMIVLVALVAVLVALYGSGHLIDWITPTATLLIAALIAFELLLIRSSFRRQLDDLSRQVVAGNPNAVFKESGELATILSLVERAETDLLMVGHSFVGVLSTQSHAILRSLHKGTRIRIVVLDPTDDALMRTVSPDPEEYPEADTLRRNIEYSLAQLARIAELTEPSADVLQVRVSRAPLTTSAVQVDGDQLSGTLLLSFFLPGRGGITQRPYFVLDRRTSSELFKTFSQSLKSIWISAKPYTFNILPAGQDSGASDAVQTAD